MLAQDFCLLGIAGYLQSLQSVFELFLLLIYLGFLLLASLQVIDEFSLDVGQELSKLTTLRIVEIIMITVTSLQLVRYLKIFGFFASFCRQLIEIVKYSVGFFSMLAFITIALAMIFYILNANDGETCGD